MLFKDRDLAVIGAGAVLTILCLMLPFSFAGKVFAGVIVLGLSLVGALARFGLDRVNLEVWLMRVWRRRRRPTRFTFQRPGYKAPTAADSAAPPEPEPSPKPVPQMPPPARTAQAAVFPIRFSVESDGLYHLASVFLVVVAVYFLAWLAQGGAAAIGRDIQQILGVFQ